MDQRWLWVLIVLLVIMVIFIILIAVNDAKAVECFAKPDGTVYCYQEGAVKRLRADKFRVIL